MSDNFGNSFFGNVLFGGTPTSGTCSFDYTAFDYNIFSTCNYQDKAPSKTSIIEYIRRKLNDNSHFSDNDIIDEIGKAEGDISVKVQTLWTRFSLNIRENVGVYPLPESVRDITAITYLGFPLDFQSQPELTRLSPTYRTQGSRPRWASLQYEGYMALRLFPVPNENISADNSLVFLDTGVSTLCIISCFTNIVEDNENISLPPWIARQIIRLFVISRMLRREGPHQDIKLADYYWARYLNEVVYFKNAIDKTYSRKLRILSDNTSRLPYRKARPVLPPNFEVPVR